MDQLLSLRLQGWKVNRSHTGRVCTEQNTQVKTCRSRMEWNSGIGNQMAHDVFKW